MALNKNFITKGISGKVGDLIFYKRMGTECVRRKPQYAPDSLSTASRQSANEFGKASKAGKLLRNALEGVLPLSHDGKMVNRLNKALFSAIQMDEAHSRGERNITPHALQTVLKDFRFNTNAHSYISSIQTTHLSDGQIQLTLPDQWQNQLKRPKGFTHIQLQIAAIGIDFNAGKVRHTATMATCLSLNMDTPLLPLQLAGSHKTATLIVMQIRFVQENGKVYTSEDKSCKLSFVAAVVPPIVTAPVVEKKIRHAQPVKANRLASFSAIRHKKKLLQLHEAALTDHFMETHVRSSSTQGLSSSDSSSQWPSWSSSSS
jgi:hypothetical protein